MRIQIPLIPHHLRKCFGVEYNAYSNDQPCSFAADMNDIHKHQMHNRARLKRLDSMAMCRAMQIIRNKAGKGELPPEAEYLASAHQRAREKRIHPDTDAPFV